MSLPPMDPDVSWMMVILAGDFFPELDVAAVRDGAYRVSALGDSVARAMADAGDYSSNVLGSVGGETASSFADFANKLNDGVPGIVNATTDQIGRAHV